jgi:hypothetical protein
MLAWKKEELAGPQSVIVIAISILPASNCHSGSILENKI